MRIPRGACPHWLIRTPLSTLVTSDRVKQWLIRTPLSTLVTSDRVKQWLLQMYERPPMQRGRTATYESNMGDGIAFGVYQRTSWARKISS